MNYKKLITALIIWLVFGWGFAYGMWSISLASITPWYYLDLVEPSLRVILSFCTFGWLVIVSGICYECIVDKPN